MLVLVLYIRVVPSLAHYLFDLFYHGTDLETMFVKRKARFQAEAIRASAKSTRCIPLGSTSDFLSTLDEAVVNRSLFVLGESFSSSPTILTDIACLFYLGLWMLTFTSPSVGLVHLSGLQCGIF